ncbi:hypothetical protein B0H65DRAFT_431582 [Neurospora tetraspora]|uniref:Uncharacterized protein n=1 Tax=Neurospora tetraspora TaxID=94610 RepID=A0AAE0JAZ9_9PEZI|nr:hypothetical protein B0H65DRAFT_431582 [Neurospora tetraspora]
MAKSLPDMVELISSPSAVKSPDSDVSPRTQNSSKPRDYFSPQAKAHSSDSENQTPAVDYRAATTSPTSGTSASRRASIVSPLSLADSFQDESRRTSQSGGSSSDRPPVGSRKSSAVSISFQAPRHPALPQGKPRKTDNRRLRASSPSPVSHDQSALQLAVLRKESYVVAALDYVTSATW